MWCRAVGAQAPVDDLGLIDEKAVVVRRGKAGRLADGTVDICDGPAGPADEMMVVVTHTRLVAGDGTGRLDPPHQTRSGQGMQHVVHGLPGNVGQNGAHGPEDRLRVGMWTLVHSYQHRDPRSGHA